jgi:hypothetical protein
MRSYAVNTWLFNVSFGVYLIYRAYSWSSGRSTHPLLDGYLADVLALPVILALTEDMVALLKGAQFRLSTGMVIFAWVYTSVTMEVLAPMANKNAVADGYDVLAYGLGALLYLKWGATQGQSVLRIMG